MTLSLMLMLFCAACAAEEYNGVRSTRPGDGDGEGGSGDGDGDGDGDGESGSGDGDGDGDGAGGSGDGDGDGEGGSGDGDGDGDGSGIAGISTVSRSEMPLPAGATAARAVSLSDEGHVLLYASVEGASKYFLWSGDKDEEPAPIVMPEGYTAHSMGCIATGDVIAVETAFPQDMVRGTRRYAALKDGVVEEVGFPAGSGGVPHFVECTPEGVFIVAGAGEIFIMRKGVLTEKVSVVADFYSLNGEGAVGTSLGIWRDGELLSPPTKDGFKFYSGPSDDGIALGSVNEIALDETQGALWNIATGEITQIPQHPQTRKVLGPMRIGRKGDLVVGSNPASMNGNLVYLRRNNRYAYLGTAGEDFFQVIDLNTKGQVLVEGVPPTYGVAVYSPN